MPDPRAFLALDLGAATTSAALVARVRHRWRLIGSLALPASIDTEAIVRLLLERSTAADPELAASLGYRRTEAHRCVATPHRAQRAAAAVCSRSRRPSGRSLRSRMLLVGRGWRVRGLSPDTIDPLAMTATILDPGIDAVLVGAGEPPGPDERRALDDVAALVAAAAIRRPELTDPARRIDVRAAPPLRGNER